MDDQVDETEEEENLNIEELWYADPECEQEVKSQPGGGVKCIK